jgi:hypothetical protein
MMKHNLVGRQEITCDTHHGSSVFEIVTHMSG